MDASARNAALAALLIIGGFGFAAFFMPAVMLRVGEWSGVAAGAVALLFVVAFFATFWLRARWQRGRDEREGRR